MYIAIQGQTRRDTFSVVVWDRLFSPEEVFIDVIDGSPVGEVYNIQQHLSGTAGSRYDKI